MIAILAPAYSQALPQSTDYVRILPEIVLSVFGMIVMALEPLLDEEKNQKVLGLIALAGTLAGLAATWFMAQSPGLAFWNMVQVDGFSVFFHVLVIAIGAVVILCLRSPAPPIGIVAQGRNKPTSVVSWTVHS